MPLLHRVEVTKRDWRRATHPVALRDHGVGEHDCALLLHGVDRGRLGCGRENLPVASALESRRGEAPEISFTAHGHLKRERISGAHRIRDGAGRLQLKGADGAGVAGQFTLGRNALHDDVCRVGVEQGIVGGNARQPRSRIAIHDRVALRDERLRTFAQWSNGNLADDHCDRTPVAVGDFATLAEIGGVSEERVAHDLHLGQALRAVVAGINEDDAHRHYHADVDVARRQFNY